MAANILVANSNVPQLTSDKCVVSKLEATLFHAQENLVVLSYSITIRHFLTL